MTDGVRKATDVNPLSIKWWWNSLLKFSRTKRAVYGTIPFTCSVVAVFSVYTFSILVNGRTIDFSQSVYNAHRSTHPITFSQAETHFSFLCNVPMVCNALKSLFSFMVDPFTPGTCGLITISLELASFIFILSGHRLSRKRFTFLSI